MCVDEGDVASENTTTVQKEKAQHEQKHDKNVLPEYSDELWGEQLWPQCLDLSYISQ